MNIVFGLFIVLALMGLVMYANARKQSRRRESETRADPLFWQHAAASDTSTDTERRHFPFFNEGVPSGAHHRAHAEPGHITHPHGGHQHEASGWHHHHEPGVTSHHDTSSMHSSIDSSHSGSFDSGSSGGSSD